MSDKIKVISLVNKKEQVEVSTGDNKYSLTGVLSSDEYGARAFDGGAVVRSEDGVQVACINSWSRHGGLSVQIQSGQDLMGVSTVVKELTDAFEYEEPRMEPATEGGAA